MKQFKIKRLLTYLFLVLGLLIITHVILRVSLFQSYNTKVDFTMSDENNVVIKLNKPNPFDSAVEKKNKRNIQDDEAFKLANSFCKKNYTYSFMGKADASLPSFVDGDEFRGKGNHIYDLAGGLRIYSWKSRFICANNLDEALFAYYKKKPESYSSLIQGVPVSYYNSSTISQSLISSDVRKKFAKYTTTDPLLEKNKVAKKEPTQTQQVVEKKESKKKAVKVIEQEQEEIKINTTTTKQVEKIDPLNQELINKFTNYEKNCVPIEKVGLFDKKTKEIAKPVKEKVCLKVKDILKLGNFKPIKSYPEGMIGSSCKIDNFHCIAIKAGKKVYEIFVRRGPLYHARKPGTIIMGMSWYEIMYLNNLKKNEKFINRYLNNDPESYSKFNSDVKKINSLIKVNEGRIKMREALGFSIDDEVEDVIKGQWLLASFLNNDELKVKKVKIDPDIKKRKILLAKYKSSIVRYKKKLKEKNN